MRPSLVIALLGMLAVSHCRRPPWYKPCWIFLCGMDLTSPICAWDPRHGARLFRNDCEMDRHNWCYSRNYAVVDHDNDMEEDINLCTKLKKIVDNAEEKPSVVQEGNVRVHFLEDPSGSEKRRRAEMMGGSWESGQESLPENPEPARDRYGRRSNSFNKGFDTKEEMNYQQTRRV